MIRKLGLVRHGNKEDWNNVYSKAMKICNMRTQTIYAADGFPNRSIRQNSYYHGVIIPILSNHFGYTPSEMKDALAIEFYPKKIKTIHGEEIESAGHSSDLNTKEMTDVIDRIRHWASEEHGCFIPPPNHIPDEITIQMSENGDIKL